ICRRFGDRCIIFLMKGEWDSGRDGDAKPISPPDVDEASQRNFKIGIVRRLGEGEGVASSFDEGRLRLQFWTVLEQGGFEVRSWRQKTRRWRRLGLPERRFQRSVEERIQVRLILTQRD